MNRSVKWFSAIATVAFCLAMAPGSAWGDPDLAGALELDSAPLGGAPMVLLSLDGIQFKMTDTSGQFTYDAVSDGPFLLTSVFNVSGQTFLDGSLLREGRPLATAVVLLFQLGGTPHVGLIWFNGTYSIGGLTSGFSTLLIAGIIIPG